AHERRHPRGGSPGRSAASRLSQSRAESPSAAPRLQISTHADHEGGSGGLERGSGHRERGSGPPSKGGLDTTKQGLEASKGGLDTRSRGSGHAFAPAER